MCSNPLPPFDELTIQSTGPFRLRPGAVNDLIFGVVYAANLDYPCPDISKLQYHSDLAQALVDDCFSDPDDIMAPDVEVVELDREIVLLLSNSPASNNFNEQYQAQTPTWPFEGADSTYDFEGYLVYQLRRPGVQPDDFDNADLARLVQQVDVKNGIGTVYDWLPVLGFPTEPGPTEQLFYPEVQVEGEDKGIRHSFRITEDQFASSTDRRLLNHRPYYFAVRSYAYNNFREFDPLDGLGQNQQFMGSRLNTRTYRGTPRPILDVQLNASYGDGPPITRIDGVGVGGHFVELDDAAVGRILDGTANGEVTYKPGAGPIEVKITDPLSVVDGEYEIRFVDENMGNAELDSEVYWELRDLGTNGPPLRSDHPISYVAEQLFGQYGFSVSIAQTVDVGPTAEAGNRGIGATLTYADPSKPFWFSGIYDDFQVPGLPYGGYFDFVANPVAASQVGYAGLGRIGDGFFVPYQVCDYLSMPGAGSVSPFYISPAVRIPSVANLVFDEDSIASTNNVDLVFTADKTKWSRCVVVDLFNDDYADFAKREDGSAVQPVGGTRNFDLRNSPSVGKDDANGDGLPDTDGDGIGMGWFPGYAIDVETGERLNVFFGENSAYSAANGYLANYAAGAPNGADMLFNPTSQIVFDPTALGPLPPNSPMQWYAGGQHFVYVTSEKYDSCAYLRSRLDPAEPVFKKITALRRVTWAGLPVLAAGQKLLPYQAGLIPNDLAVRLRVDNPYEVAIGTGEASGYPTYRFKIEGKQAQSLSLASKKTALDAIQMVPNPYYAYSEYESDTAPRVVKITNLPAVCEVTIYTLDGRLVRRFDRDEAPGGPPNRQVLPDLEWNLQNGHDITVGAGVYLVHVKVPGVGAHTLKWFVMPRMAGF